MFRFIPLLNLPSHAEKEAIKVAHKFNVNPLLRDEAKKEIVIESSINKDLLHLSCHAMFEAGFSRFSRLMLANDNIGYRSV
ncbi:CHAT domain-containing protein [Methanophagales archaeon]|nr:MAG: CHAT domain-containing protein [Methanophagales archaeon]